MYRSLFALLIGAPLALSQSACGPDCSSGSYALDVLVLENDVSSILGSETKFLGWADDPNLFRGCESLSRSLTLIHPSSLGAFDGIVAVGGFNTLGEPIGDPLSGERWVLEEDALSSLEFVAGNFQNRAAELPGLNSLELIFGEAFGFCQATGLNSLREVGTLKIGDGPEGPECDQSGLVSLEAVSEDLIMGGFELVSPPLSSEEEYEAFPWFTYELPGQIRTVGHDVFLTGSGHAVLRQLEVVGRDIRVVDNDNRFADGHLRSLTMPSLREVGYELRVNDSRFDELVIPDGVRATVFSMFRARFQETVNVTGSFAQVEAAAFVDNDKLTTAAIDAFMAGQVGEYDVLVHCKNVDDAEACDEEVLAEIRRNRPD